MDVAANFGIRNHCRPCDMVTTAVCERPDVTHIPLDFYCCADVRALICDVKIQARELRLQMVHKKMHSINQEFGDMECRILTMQALAEVLEEGGDMPEKTKNAIVSKLMKLRDTYGCF